MCNLFSYLCCCCKTKTSDGTDQTNVMKKLMKSQKSASETKYGTDWESNLIRFKNMTPEDIADSMVTKHIEIEEREYTSQMDFYRTVGLKCGFEFVSEENIGKGGFGEIFKIREINGGEIRALKIMALKRKDKYSESRFAAFKCEIFSLRRNDHKNIIKLFDHFMIRDSLSFMILEYAAGGDLKNRLKDRYQTTNKAFPEDEAKRYFAQICNAMFSVHRNGIIHGDLKLENVLIQVDSNGVETIKVTDFGCARVAFKDSTGMVAPNKAIGTVICMAPEQIRVFICVNLNKPYLLKKKRANTYNPFRSDIWGLGVLLFRMLCFDYPFTYDKHNTVKTIVPMLRSMKKGFNVPKEVKISDSCLDLLKSLLEYDKSKRIDIQIAMTHKWLIDCPDLDKV